MSRILRTLNFALCFGVITQTQWEKPLFCSELPDITTRTYTFTPTRMSTSKNVVLFKTSGQDLPPVGKVLLLKRGDDPIVGLRVLKVISDSGKVIAKKIRPSPSSAILLNEPVQAIEKTSDLEFADAPSGGEGVLPSALSTESHPSKWSMSAGVGFTYFNYVEDPASVDLNETGITPKFAIAYWMIPRALDLGVSGFFTLLPVSHSPATFESSRSYGANGRIGYLLPFAPSGIGFKLLAGWYFWSLRTSDKSYGVDLLSGPQMVLAMGNWQVKRAYSGYLKFAPISESPSTMTFANRELAIGLSAPLPFVGETPIFLTLDVAFMNFAALSVQNHIRQNSYTIGIQTVF